MHGILLVLTAANLQIAASFSSFLLTPGYFHRSVISTWFLPRYYFLLIFTLSDDMKLKTVALVACLLSGSWAHAQDELFGTPKREAKKGFVISLAGNLDFPGGDMARRFGTSYRVGPSVFYKTRSNWLLGVKADFILGNKVEEPGFLQNIRTSEGTLITTEGFRKPIETYERGYAIGLQFGKTINFSKTNPDNGLQLITSAGFIQHKIHIVTRNAGTIPQLQGDYKKGYDRLANGMYVEQYAGYVYYANNGLVNFTVGLDVLAGFTQGRRDYLFDVGRPGNDKRFDLLFGIRGAWFIPIFRRKSEEIFFE